MATILRFPSENIKERNRIEQFFWRAIEAYSPELREAKHKALMEMYDRIRPPVIPVTIENLKDEPFTERQIEVITKEMHILREDCDKRMCGFILELVTLKLTLIDLGKV